MKMRSKNTLRLLVAFMGLSIGGTFSIVKSHADVIPIEIGKPPKPTPTPVPTPEPRWKDAGKNCQASWSDDGQPHIPAPNPPNPQPTGQQCYDCCGNYGNLNPPGSMSGASACYAACMEVTTATPVPLPTPNP